MSQNAREPRTFLVPMRRPHAGSDPSRPGQRGRRTVRPFDPFRTPAEMPIHASNLASFQIRGRILSASHPPSSSAPLSNPHSARCTTGPNFRDFVLGAFWTPAPHTARGRVVMPASKNLHRSGHSCVRSSSLRYLEVKYLLANSLGRSPALRMPSAIRARCARQNWRRGAFVRLGQNRAMTAELSDGLPQTRGRWAMHR